MSSALEYGATPAAALLLGLLTAAAVVLLVARRRGWMPRLGRGSRHDVGIRVIDVKWLAGRTGCALLEVGQQRFLVPIGEARTPMALPAPLTAAPTAQEHAADA
jgi:hypothetical protein